MHDVKTSRKYEVYLNFILVVFLIVTKTNHKTQKASNEHRCWCWYAVVVYDSVSLNRVQLTTPFIDVYKRELAAPVTRWPIHIPHAVSCISRKSQQYRPSCLFDVTSKLRHSATVDLVTYAARFPQDTVSVNCNRHRIRSHAHANNIIF